MIFNIDYSFVKPLYLIITSFIVYVNSYRRIYVFLGLKLDIVLNFLNNFFSSGFKLLGTIILTLTIKSPLLPFPSLYPFPETVSVSPVCIPSGTSIWVPSSIEYTVVFVPNAASHGVKYKFVNKLFPTSLNLSLSFIFTFINKSPFFPPFIPWLSLS